MQEGSVAKKIYEAKETERRKRRRPKRIWMDDIKNHLTI